MTNNYAVTFPSNRFINGVGSRIDIHLSPDDARDGIFVEVTVDVLAGPVNVELFNTMREMSDAELVLEKAGNTIWDTNNNATGQYYLGAISFNYTAVTKAIVLIKPSEVIAAGAVTLPDDLKPILTLKIASTAVKVVSIDVTRKGVH